ncbi:MAG TPA: hypothetical protein VIM38_02050 [Alphaproteobacteria bacterium]
MICFISVPTPEHYLPLLYVIGAQAEGDEVDVVADGIDMGSVSMLSAALSSDQSNKSVSFPRKREPIDPRSGSIRRNKGNPPQRHRDTEEQGEKLLRLLLCVSVPLW